MARDRKHNFDLSENTGIRTMQLVDNSLPNPDRPRMSEPIEGELEVVERKAAALLAARELSHWQFAQSHKELMTEIELLRKHLRAKLAKHQKQEKPETGSGK